MFIPVGFFDPGSKVKKACSGHRIQIGKTEIDNCINKKEGSIGTATALPAGKLSSKKSLNFWEYRRDSRGGCTENISYSIENNPKLMQKGGGAGGGLNKNMQHKGRQGKKSLRLKLNCN